MARDERGSAGEQTIDLAFQNRSNLGSHPIQSQQEVDNAAWPWPVRSIRRLLMHASSPRSSHLYPLETTLTRLSTIAHETSTLSLPLPGLVSISSQKGTRLYSKDYQNMHLACKQYLWSLIGMKNRLTLRSDVGNDTVLKSEASLPYTGSAEHVSIVVKDAGSARVNALDIDEVLHRLVNKMDHGCQLGLMCLHAPTSYCTTCQILPDTVGGGSARCTSCDRCRHVRKRGSCRPFVVGNTFWQGVSANGRDLTQSIRLRLGRSQDIHRFYP